MNNSLSSASHYRWLHDLVYHEIVNRPGYGSNIAWVTFDRLPIKYYLEVIEMGYAPAVEITNSQ